MTIKSEEHTINESATDIEDIEDFLTYNFIKNQDKNSIGNIQKLKAIENQCENLRKQNKELIEKNQENE